jgi:hypothetical protein
VQAFLNENPDFAAEFSQTIPISPKIAASDPEDLPRMARKRQRQPVEEEEEEEVVDEDADDADGGSRPLAKEDEDEEEGEDAAPVGDDEDECGAQVDEEDPDGTEIPEDEEEEEEEDKDKKKKKSSRRASEEEEDEGVKPEWGAALGHEADVFGSPVPDSDTPSLAKKDKDKGKGKKKSPAPSADKEKGGRPVAEAPISEEDEAMEKMHLIEEIKENSSMGLVPPQPPSYNMPLKLLRQIRRFQEEKAAEIMTMGMMGTGLVSIVGALEALNGRFDPFGKMFGRGLKLRGAKDSIEEKLDLYRVPFARMYRDMKKKGHNVELPPWAQIIFITGGILKDVHMTNTYKEMQEEASKEQNDPVALRRAQDLLRRKYEAQQSASAQQAQMAADKRPYHADVAATAAVSPQSDSEMEATLAKEFAGFDRLPSLESIAAKRKDVMSSVAAPEIVAPPPPPPHMLTAKPVTVLAPMAAGGGSDVKFVHAASEPGGAKIAMTHGEETRGGDEDVDEDDEEEDEEEDAPIIQVPTVNPVKKN